MNDGQTDILIVGGGMVGASLAIALSGHGRTVTVLERHPPRAPAPPSYDDRTLALNHTTCNALQALQVWPLIREATPIRRVHTREEGGFGSVMLEAARHGFDNFGHVVFARELGHGLLQRLEHCGDVRWLQPAALESLAQDEHGVSAVVEQDGQRLQLRARLLVAADGADSTVARLLQVPAECTDYGQVAVISNVSVENGHRHTGWECLSRQGPFALLPLAGERCGVVWSVPAGTEHELLQMDEAHFLQRLQQRFGYRLGRFTRAGRRTAYPLRARVPREIVWHRVLLLGNAAHAVHPLSAQGFNLGMRDVAVLAEMLCQAGTDDPGQASLLQAYARRRHADVRRIVRWTDGMVRLYRQRSPLVAALRQLGLNLTGHAPPFQRRILALTMGLLEQDSPLLRGESL